MSHRQGATRSNDIENHYDYDFGVRRIACGTRGHVGIMTTDHQAITCKRCLASLAKRDREFQRKARSRLVSAVLVRIGSGHRLRAECHICARRDSARAIAREEGRAL